MGWSGPMTHRQYLAWNAWLDDQWNKPDRSDNYLMALTAEVRRVLHRKPKSVKTEHFKLKFVENKRAIPTDPKAKARMAQASANRWIQAVGGIKEVIVVQAEPTEPEDNGNSN